MSNNPSSPPAMTPEALLQEIHEWRHVVAYFLGDMADRATPAECRAEAIKRALAAQQETPHRSAAVEQAEILRGWNVAPELQAIADRIAYPDGRPQTRDTK